MEAPYRHLRGITLCKRGVAALEFVFLAPALLALAFGVIIYSIYFSAVIGVHQAASEGARAAMAGLSQTERQDLAIRRAGEILTNYGSLLGGKSPVVTAAPDTTPGVFKVTIVYDMSSSPIMEFGSFVPLPQKQITASVLVTNGGY